MKKQVITIFSWIITLWTAKVFLSSLPYKFSLHPDTQHIFGTIGGWMQGIVGDTIGVWFAHYGSYAVGIAELIASSILLAPAVLFLLKKVAKVDLGIDRSVFHCIGGLFSACVMAGAVFFHLITPLGIEVLHQGKSDGGSLFYAAVSILILGSVMAIANFSLIKDKS
ncbi:hypothetical protein [Pelagibaculum spongiae]|uniref:Uncharacterized protein n=1 Tax=Pelagibaculum spongiae TaxID=2080658 RepID=A0A2V1H314_9GAMM|nr:hypothetical protein [Pelagibaculum spongiae]PVZ69687.1 hypothetical protein DC094_10325 [Pelagibaculum spongiae]